MYLTFLNIGAPEIIMILIPLIFLGVFYIYAIIHCLRNHRLQGNTKLLWLIIILIAPGIGGLIYLLAGRKGNRVDPV